MSNIMSNRYVNLIAAYSFEAKGISKGGIVVNQSIPSLVNSNNPSTMNLTLVQTSVTNGVFFNGKSSRTSSTIAIGNFKTIQFYIKPTVNNVDLIQLSGSGKISTNSSNVITTTGLSSPEIYVNGILSTTLPLNIWSSVTIRTSVLFNASAFIVGYSSTYFKGYLKDLRINKDFLNWKDYHNYFASKIVLKEDFSNYPVGATRFGNWKIVSGSFVMAEDKKGKYLKCTSSGVIQIPLVDADKKYIKKYTGNMTTSTTSKLFKLTATTNQISRLLILSQAATV